MNIARIDLNLLVFLDVLLRERNVTRAAQSLGITQPAMSNGLRRLRELFGDPLLIHTEPNQAPNPRPYGVCTVLVPALSGRLTLNGQQARDKPWPRDREGRPFSTSALAFSESWTETR